jgi:hypothetical protein
MLLFAERRADQLTNREKGREADSAAWDGASSNSATRFFPQGMNKEAKRKRASAKRTPFSRTFSS